MRWIYAVALVVLFTAFASAKDRDWQDAIFLGATSSQDGAFAMPIGTTIIAAPITSQHYWFKSGGLQYYLWLPPRSFGRRVPNLTVNGHAKIAVDGRHVHVLDDDGKDWKLTVTSKIAPKE